MRSLLYIANHLKLKAQQKHFTVVPFTQASSKALQGQNTELNLKELDSVSSLKILLLLSTVALYNIIYKYGDLTVLELH